MTRIQFYPSAELERKITEEAQKYNVAPSVLVIQILNERFGLNKTGALGEAEITKQVFAEITDYISAANLGDEFDLLSASDTFAKIEMVCNGKPSAVRAKIGKQFAREIGSGVYANVSRAYKPNGKLKKSVNNATIYRIV